MSNVNSLAQLGELLPFLSAPIQKLVRDDLYGGKSPVDILDLKHLEHKQNGIKYKLKLSTVIERRGT